MNQIKSIVASPNERIKVAIDTPILVSFPKRKSVSVPTMTGPSAKPQNVTENTAIELIRTLNISGVTMCNAAFNIPARENIVSCIDKIETYNKVSLFTKNPMAEIGIPIQRDHSETRSGASCMPRDANRSTRIPMAIIPSTPPTLINASMVCPISPAEMPSTRRA